VQSPCQPDIFNNFSNLDKNCIGQMLTLRQFRPGQPGKKCPLGARWKGSVNHQVLTMRKAWRFLEMEEIAGREQGLVDGEEEAGRGRCRG
jgi:hypothetical protein